MAQPFPLQLLLELTQEKADVASRKLGKLIAEEQRTRQRLRLLEEYRGEYLGKFRAAQASGLSPLAWSNYQSFITKLDEAIEQQRRIVEAAAKTTVLGQQKWLAQNKQAKALDTLAGRHQTRLQLAENRAEQKLLDEYTTRKQFPETDY